MIKTVIDIHTHAFPDALAERAINSLIQGCNGEYMPCSDGTLNGLLNNMEKFHIDLSVVQPVITKPSQTKTLNEWAQSIQNDKIISFGGIHPDSDDCKRDIDFVCDLGLKGIKFHPEYQQFEIDDPKMLKIYDYALSKGLIILFHAGYDPAYPPPIHSSPKRFAEISKEMQGGVMIAAHLGGQRQWDEVYEDLAGTNMYLDTSMGFNYYSNEQFLRIVEKHGADKILFGTDSPWSRGDEEIKSLEAMPLSQEQKELIFYKNAKRILDI